MDSDVNGNTIISSKIDELLKQVSEEVTVIQATQRQDQEDMEALRFELGMLKRAYISLEADNKELEEKLRTIDRRNEALQNSERRAVCLVDGDGSIFAKDFVVQGREGGLKAARTLREAINSSLDPDAPATTWVYVFMNKRGLVGPLGVSDVNMDDFISGFNQAEGRTFVVDIGYGKEIINARVRDLLQDSARSPYVSKIFFGGSYDNDYVPILESLITCGGKEKLTLLSGFAEVAYGIKRLDLPTLDVPGLFESKKLVSVASTRQGSQLAFIKSLSPPRDKPVSATAPVAPGPFGMLDSNSVHNASATPATKPARYLNLNIPLWANNPPMCNMHYVVGKCVFKNCKYSHDYILRPGELERIRAECKRMPCDNLQRGQTCPRQDVCIYRHRCKHGAKCDYFKKGTCNFGTDDAHKNE